MPRAAGIYANFTTMKGNFTCRLFEKDAPRTVANFIRYAQDRKQYDGTIFHRVIENLLIQGGDPSGTGTGGFENKIDDEFKGSPHNFNKPGKLAVASAGRNANGSQFLITVVPAAFLTAQAVMMRLIYRWILLSLTGAIHKQSGLICSMEPSRLSKSAARKGAQLCAV